ncbi:MAG: hypothetical protein R6V41_11035 [Desulfobacteraceae bacterium]
MAENQSSENRNGSPGRIESRILRLRLVDESQLVGRVNINRGGGYDRVSDLLVSSEEPFLVMFSVTVYFKDIEKPIKYKTFFVNKSHILWASPEEDQV